ncbi:MAG: serine/threonine protein kinase [Planctomycetes bacterium]|nr:serine/threonine protein kinase [Planctomycetota bacterium]
MSPDQHLSDGTIGSATFALRSRWRFWATLGAIMLAVLAIGVLALGVVRSELRHLAETNLATIRDSAAHASHDWMVRRTNLAAAFAVRPPLIEALAAHAGGDKAAAGRLRQLTDPFVAPLGLSWWAMVDPDGRILANPDPAADGRTLPAAIRDGVAAAMKGKPLLLPPTRIEGSEEPHFLACARIAGKVPAVLILGTGLHQDFARLFSAHPGTTGEIYAFDRQGRMLTESRFTAQLRGTLLPPEATSTIFAIELRDSEGAAPGVLRSTLPFTRPVREGIAGRAGIDLDGYQDYRGHRVLGAWTWCEEHQIGIAVKMDRDEAYRALHLLLWMNGGLVALILLAGVAVAVFLLVNARLARRARHAERSVKELGQYRLERKLGEGGMGAVYVATHRLLRRKTAVKMITGRVDAETVAKFEREVQLCSQLTHPNTIAVYDFGRTAQGEFYYAMECLAGMDLQDLVERHGPLPAGRVIHLLVQACGSLAEAHRARLLHRDIKPANLFVTERGGIHDFIKVLDFGLVKKLGGNTGSTLSQADVISGTPAYMAPETINQRPGVDGRVDLYAIGLVGYFLLTGRDAFSAEAVMDLLMAHLNAPPPKPSALVPVAADLEAVLLRCLAKDPAERPADADMLAEELLACQDAGSWTAGDARRWWRDHPLETKAATEYHGEATVTIAT